MYRQFSLEIHSCPKISYPDRARIVAVPCTRRDFLRLAWDKLWLLPSRFRSNVHLDQFWTHLTRTQLWIESLRKCCHWTRSMEFCLSTRICSQSRSLSGNRNKLYVIDENHFKEITIPYTLDWPFEATFPASMRTD